MVGPSRWTPIKDSNGRHIGKTMVELQSYRCMIGGRYLHVFSTNVTIGLARVPLPWCPGVVDSFGRQGVNFPLARTAEPMRESPLRVNR